VLAFVRAARSLPSVRRIALIGSPATDNPVPKDADVLVTIDAAMDLGPLASLGRRLQGTVQRINLGADILLADEGTPLHRPDVTKCKVQLALAAPQAGRMPAGPHFAPNSYSAACEGGRPAAAASCSCTLSSSRLGMATTL
jgi:hypothetical protein